MGYILAAKWFLFWCNYSQQTLSASFLCWDLPACVLCVWEALIYVRMPSTYIVCEQSKLHTMISVHKTHRLCASRLIILITLPSSDLQIPNSTNKHHSQINSQTSLKQHLPLTTSAHQLKGSHRRSIKIDSLFGRRVSKYTAFSFTTDGTDKQNGECAKMLGCLCLDKASLVFRNSGLTTLNQPAATQSPLTSEAAITSATEWSACYITSQAWPQSEQRGSKID